MPGDPLKEARELVAGAKRVADALADTPVHSLVVGQKPYVAIGALNRDRLVDLLYNLSNALTRPEPVAPAAGEARERLARLLYSFSPHIHMGRTSEMPPGHMELATWDECAGVVHDGYRARADAILSALQPADSPCAGERETFPSIKQWCEETFGSATPRRIAERAQEEMNELLDETEGQTEWTDKAAIEAADVLICLARVPDIWTAVERKMRINRARKWRLTGEGSGYHIPDALPSSSASHSEGVE